MIIEIYELWFLLSCNRLPGLLWGIKVSTQREKKWKPWKSCEIEYKACFLTTAGDFHTRCLTFHLKRIRYNCFKFYVDHCYEGKNTTCHLLERFSVDCSNTKTKVITLANHKGQTIQWTNQNSKQIHVADVKRGKTCTSESRLALVLLLIGWQSGASFLSQSCSVVNTIPIT